MRVVYCAAYYLDISVGHGMRKAQLWVSLMDTV